MMFPGAYSFGVMGWWMVLWGAVCIAAVVLLLLLVVRLVTPPDASRADEARRILDMRLARGEIDEKEYRDRRSLIG